MADRTHDVSRANSPGHSYGIPSLNVTRGFFRGSNRDATRWSNLTSQRGSEANVRPTAVSIQKAAEQRLLEHKFRMLSTLSNVKHKSESGGLGDVQAAQASTRIKFQAAVKDLNKMTIGNDTAESTEKKTTEDRKKIKSVPRATMPVIDPMYAGKSNSQKSISKQLEIYRNSKQMRLQLKNRTRQHRLAEHAGDELLQLNKMMAANPKLREIENQNFRARESKRREMAMYKKKILEKEQEFKMNLMRSRPAKHGPDFVKLKNLQRMQKYWLTIIALGSRTSAAMEIIMAADSGLDINSLTMESERRKHKPYYLVRNRVLRARDSLGGLWRCFVVQRLLDKFRDKIIQDIRKRKETERIAALDETKQTDTKEEGKSSTRSELEYIDDDDITQTNTPDKYARPDYTA
ncbi:hypothetical protein AAMO2058_001688800 [Amorphochlora amoebiformis]